jgi:hypothetical protein
MRECRQLAVRTKIEQKENKRNFVGSPLNPAKKDKAGRHRHHSGSDEKQPGCVDVCYIFFREVLFAYYGTLSAICWISNAQYMKNEMI